MVKFYRAGGRILAVWFAVLGERTCPTNTTTTTTPVSTTTVPNIPTTTTTSCRPSCPEGKFCCNEECCVECCVDVKEHCCGDYGNYCCSIFVDCCYGVCCRIDQKCVSNLGCVGKVCVSSLIYGEHSEKAELLRVFRDEVLNQSPEGQEIISLYYQWSPVIVKAMEKDEEFKTEVKEIIDGVLGLITEEAE